MPREPTSSLVPGTLLGGRIRLVRPIASGGMGTVWIARNESTGAEVAAKIWQPRGDDADTTQDRFRHEAQLGATLAHRSIVRVFDLIAEPDGTLVLVMELLRGETLEKHLAERGTLDARESVAIVVPILSALQHAHEMGVTHRDVKPANIYLCVDPDGAMTPKLLDFGIAKTRALGNLTTDGSVLGTPRYMSPEHIRGKADLDGRSDLFAVASVLHEMLTGRAPFQGTTASAVLAAVLEQDIDPDPNVDPRLWNEIARGLAKQPYERHRSASEMASALCAAIGEDEAGLATSLRRSKPPPRDAVSGAVSSDLASALPARSMHSASIAKTWIPWAVAGAVVLVVVSTFTVVSLSRDHAPAPATSVDVVPSAPSSAAQAPASGSTAASATAAPIASPRASQTMPAMTATATTKPRASPPTRGVATTPGF